MERKNSYVTPSVKMVKFKVEVGVSLSLHSSTATGATWDDLSVGSNGGNNSNTSFFERSWDE